MKQLLILPLFCLGMIIAIAQNKVSKTSSPDKTKRVLIVETSCGECKFGLPGKTCDLAIRINGQAYFVDGTNIDEHGDAHAKDGFCNAIRKAKVQGEIVNNRFKATYFQLMPGVPKKKP